MFSTAWQVTVTQTIDGKNESFTECVRTLELVSNVIARFHGECEPERLVFKFEITRLAIKER